MHTVVANASDNNSSAPRRMARKDMAPCRPGSRHGLAAIFRARRGTGGRRIDERSPVLRSTDIHRNEPPCGILPSPLVHCIFTTIVTWGRTRHSGSCIGTLQAFFATNASCMGRVRRGRLSHAPRTRFLPASTGPCRTHSSFITLKTVTTAQARRPRISSGPDDGQPVTRPRPIPQGDARRTAVGFSSIIEWDDLLVGPAGSSGCKNDPGATPDRVSVRKELIWTMCPPGPPPRHPS